MTGQLCSGDCKTTTVFLFFSVCDSSLFNLQLLRYSLITILRLVFTWQGEEWKGMAACSSTLTLRLKCELTIIG